MRARRALPALLAALAASAVLAAGCGDDDETEAGFVITGTWTGQLTQQGLEPFQVTATIRSLEQPSENTVHYTGIDCGGNWTYLGGEDPFRFREVISRGAGGKCKGVGTVTLTPSGDDEVEYTFHGGGVASAGRLLHRANP